MLKKICLEFHFVYWTKQNKWWLRLDLLHMKNVFYFLVLPTLCPVVENCLDNKFCMLRCAGVRKMGDLHFYGYVWPRYFLLMLYVVSPFVMQILPALLKLMTSVVLCAVLHNPTCFSFFPYSSFSILLILYYCWSSSVENRFVGLYFFLSPLWLTRSWHSPRSRRSRIRTFDGLLRA